MNISPISNQAQEALETAAQTRIEAVQGDVQAKMKLAQMTKLQVHQPVPVPVPGSAAPAVDTHTDATPSAPPPPAGAVLNVKR